ncbi:hypothetical protein HK097_008933 [Rhizophlyctis rosea]|uniref:SH3 domain-containing protein n=1 Tax=Rhizophlyctis rosea TaxID=64517 RepID=A0AAD5SBS6_9FUNG|nr:hypothetical protein HK097_008933 [Rhizophlyctis rosea]
MEYQPRIQIVVSFPFINSKTIYFPKLMVTFPGFLNQGNALIQCRNLRSDQCCATFLGAQTTTTTARSSPTTSSSATSPTAPATDADTQSSSSSSGGSKTGIIIGVVVTLLILGAIFVACFLIRRRRRRSDLDKNDFGQGYAPYHNTHSNYPSYDGKEDLSVRAIAAGRGMESAGGADGLQAGVMNAQRSSDIPLAAFATPQFAGTPPPQESPFADRPPVAPTRSPSQTVPMRVIHPYNPTLQDELTLVPGTTILLLKAFDDGWALGLQPETGKQGAFPLVCVAPVEGDAPALTPEQVNAERASLSINKRVSSVVDFEGFEGYDNVAVPTVPERYLSGGVPAGYENQVIDDDATLQRPKVFPAAPETNPFSGPFDDEHVFPPQHQQQQQQPQPKVAAIATPIVGSSSPATHASPLQQTLAVEGNQLDLNGSPRPYTPIQQGLMVTNPDGSTGSVEDVGEKAETESALERERARILSLNLGQDVGSGTLDVGVGKDGKQ